MALYLQGDVRLSAQEFLSLRIWRAAVAPSFETCQRRTQRKECCEGAARPLWAFYTDTGRTSLPEARSLSKRQSVEVIDVHINVLYIPTV